MLKFAMLKSELLQNQKAAEQGNAVAQFNMGRMHHTGNGNEEEVDFKKAFKMYEKAVKQGNKHAQHNLGCMYYKGEGVGQDYARAMQLWQSASFQGLAEAQACISTMYMNGCGIEKDLSEAHHWFMKAKANGFVSMCLEPRPTKRDLLLLEEEIETLDKKLKSFNPDGGPRSRYYWRSAEGVKEKETSSKLGLVYDRRIRLKEQLKKLNEDRLCERVTVGLIVLRSTGRLVVVP